MIWMMPIAHFSYKTYIFLNKFIKMTMLNWFLFEKLKKTCNLLALHI